MSVETQLLKNPTQQQFTQIKLKEFFAMLASCPFKYCQDNGLFEPQNITIFHIHPSASKVLRAIGILTSHFACRIGTNYFVHETMIALMSEQVSIEGSQATCSTQHIVLEDLDNVKF